MRFLRALSAGPLAMSFVAMLVVACCTSVGFAGMLASTPLAFDDGDTVWQGTLPINVTTGMDTLRGKIEYAVFAPGDFSQFLEDNSITEPAWVPDAASNELMYAYQLLGDAALNGIDAAVPGVSIFTVGLDPSDVRGSVAPNIVSTGATNMRLPTAWSDNTGSMVWTYTSPNYLVTGKISPLMVFSSQYLPEWDATTTTSRFAYFNGGPTAVPSIGNVLHIVPEPASLTMLFVGAIALLFGGRCKR
jgi:hypothetical protein